MDLALSRPLPIAASGEQAVLVRTTLVTDGAGNDISARTPRRGVPRSATHPSAYLEDNEPAPRFVPRSRRTASKEKDPGSLRTGVHPAGNGLGLRCLLGARALSRPNPRPAG